MPISAGEEINGFPVQPHDDEVRPPLRSAPVSAGMIAWTTFMSR